MIQSAYWFSFWRTNPRNREMDLYYQKKYSLNLNRHFVHVQINGAFGVDFTRDIKDAKTAEECLRKVGVGLLSHGELRTIVLHSLHDEPASITQPRAIFLTFCTGT